MKNTTQKGAYRLKPIQRHHFPPTVAGRKAFETACLEIERIIQIRRRLNKTNSKPKNHK